MKKIILALSLVMAVSLPVFAGGIKANTNQSAQWVRNFARGTCLDPDAVYFNPAGTTFMKDGFHFSVGDQIVIQNRTSKIDYAPFAMYGGKSKKEYKGKTFVPVLPNIDFVWKHKRVAAMFSFGVGGGGGSAKYDNGLGVFEQAVAVLPVKLTQMGIPTSEYSLDMNLKGTSITYAANIGLAYRVTNWLSLAAELRIDYVGNKYEGYLKDIMINPNYPQMGLNGEMQSAYGLFQKVAAAMPGTELGQTAAAMSSLVADKELNSKQTGWGFSPVIAAYFKKNSWSGMLKYEFKTEIDVENDTKVDDFGYFADGVKGGYDQPSLFAVALTKRFADKVSLTGEFHRYGDQKANLGKVLGSDLQYKDLTCRSTVEYIAGLEWDVTDRFLLSGGVQYSDYDLKDDFHSELSFQLDCVSLGAGFAYKLSDKVKFNFGFCRSIYLTKKIHSVNEQSGAPVFSKYCRGSQMFSLGFDFHFAEGGKRK